MKKSFCIIALLKDSEAVLKEFLIAKAIPTKPLLKLNASRIALNRGFLLGLNPLNYTCKTSLLGSGQSLYEPKHKEAKFFHTLFCFSLFTIFLRLFNFISFSF